MQALSVLKKELVLNFGLMQCPVALGTSKFEHGAVAPDAPVVIVLAISGLLG